MKVVICYKLVPDVANVKIKADRTLDMSECDWSVSQYDLNAIEAARRLVEANEGSKLIALTAGGSITDNSKLRKAALARGPHELVIVKDDAMSDADSYATAKILSAAIEKIGDVDVAIFGEGSGDMYAQQTGNMVGAMLGWNTVNAVNNLDISDCKLVLGRNVEDGNETLDVALPAVVSVTSDICPPRIASMKDILAAGKKPVQAFGLGDIEADVENKAEVISVLAPAKTDRKKIVAPFSESAHVEDIAAKLRALM